MYIGNAQAVDVLIQPSLIAPGPLHHLKGLPVVRQRRGGEGDAALPRPLDHNPRENRLRRFAGRALTCLAFLFLLSTRNSAGRS